MIAIRRKRLLHAVEVRNRAEKLDSDDKLAKVDREKEKEARIHNIDWKRFKAKQSISKPKEDSEVKMYETHYPGFCYKRTGEQKNLPKEESVTVLDFEYIRSLIFTENEVDLEKIICLHLLCAHRTEDLTPQKKRQNHYCRAHSSTERLIERSQKGYVHYERLSKMLPLYTIELVDQGAMGERSQLINDGRLASRILINEKVMAIINAVATTLEKANSDKFRELMYMGNNPDIMRELLKSNHIAEFLESLMDHTLIHNCDFYVLTPPFKIRVQELNVKTSHGSLENIVSHLRQNVLQGPTKSLTQSKTSVDKPNELRAYSTISLPPLPRMESKKSNDAPPVDPILTMMDKVLAGQSTSKTPSRIEVEKIYTRRSTQEDQPVDRSSINYILKNKKAARKTKRIEYHKDEDEDEWTWGGGPLKRSSVASNKSRRSTEPVNIPVKTVMPPVVDEKESESVENVDAIIESVESNDNEIVSSGSPPSDTKPKERQLVDRHTYRHYIRQSTCPACIERWKTPLPTPKIRRVRQADVMPPDMSEDMKTHSHHRISMMINKAIYKLQSYDRRYSVENENNIRPPAAKKEAEDDELAENIYLNPIDLARIEQEIKERETNKRLEKFLEKYTDDKNNTNNKNNK